MTMPDKVFLDTNILVYLANVDSPFHLKVANKFKEMTRRGSQLWISRQVLREYAVVMTGHAFVEKSLSSEKIVSDIEKWESIFYVADETEEVTRLLKELIENYDVKGKRIHDANIVASMEANSIQSLCTLNTDDFKIFKKIKLIAI